MISSKQTFGQTLPLKRLYGLTSERQRKIMNKISPKKLLHSKWTAVLPQNKQKHFVVVEVEYDEDQNVVLCILEAVLTKRQSEIDWREFKDTGLWRPGWS